MNFASKHDISHARKINLSSFLEKRGYKVQPEGSENFRVIGYQGLIVREHYWYKHSTGEFGNAIDFIMKFENLKFNEALDVLLNDTNDCKNKLNWQYNDHSTEALNYLIKKRQIDHSIAQQLITLGKVKQDKGNSICFIEYDHFKQPLYIFRRSMIPNNHFKNEVKGSNKEHSFQIIIKNNKILNDQIKCPIDALYIVEGAIDACAMASLLNQKHQKKTIFFKS